MDRTPARWGEAEVHPGDQPRLNIKERCQTIRGYRSAVNWVRVATRTADLREEGDRRSSRALAA